MSRSVLEAFRFEQTLMRVLYGASFFVCVVLFVFFLFSAHPIWSIIPILITAVFIYAHWIEPNLITIKRYHLPVADQSKTTVRIAFLSDFHANETKGKKFFSRVAAKTNALKPDLILLGGDFMEERASFLPELLPLKKLKANYGKFFIIGNHDFFDDPGRVRREIEKLGFTDLSNKEEAFEIHNRPLRIVGLDDVWFGAPDLSVIHARSKEPRILLTHEPDALFDLKKGDADLVLVGHTHGGQVRLPFFGRVIPLPQKISHTFDRGRKFWCAIPVIISQGLGESVFPLRFFCPPEIVLIDLEI
ncbi:MAG TPA: metallophosphoesterase [Patescibacteria group bacterium]|nr:metallophosphoesterase [Patescibacteria group bacterium]